MTETSKDAAADVAKTALPPAVGGSDGTKNNATVKSAKKPSLLRKSAVIFFVLFGVISILLIPLLVEPWILAKVKSSLATQGLELTEGSELSISVFGGAITGKDLKLREVAQPNTAAMASAEATSGPQATPSANIFTATTLTADIALMDSLSSGDVVIESLIIEGLSGNLRRTNGRVPVLNPTAEPGKPTDWLGLGKQLMEWYKKYAPENTEASEEKPSTEPGKEPTPTKPTEKVPAKPTVATDWPKATRYEPQPQPGGKWPRLLIRHLSIHGTSMGLPDESPFDLTGFAVTGTNVAMRLNSDEVMDFKADLTTKGSGPMALVINRQGGRDGTMKLNAQKVPIEALSSPQISGSALSEYGATGLADLAIDSSWTGWKQLSTVTSTLSNMKMQPDKSASDVTRQFASAINAFGGKPIAWTPKLGGTLVLPVFTDTGIDSLKASAVGAAVEQGKEKALEEGAKQLDKQLEKNPQLKGASDKAKDLFKGLGK
jgi:hypothetical protein